MLESMRTIGWKTPQAIDTQALNAVEVPIGSSAGAKVSASLKKLSPFSHFLRTEEYVTHRVLLLY